MGLPCVPRSPVLAGKVQIGRHPGVERRIGY